MLLSKLSKLIAPLNIQFARENLSKLRSRFVNTQSTVVKKEKICPQPYEAINPFAERRQKTYQESLAKCSRTQSRMPCKIGVSKDSQVKCPSESAAEVFKRTLADVRHEALNLQIFTRNTVNAIVGSMSTETAMRAASEHATMNKRLAEVETRLNEIVAMSLICAANKRREAYAIAEGINSDLKNWQYGNASGMRCIRCRLHELECKVKERTDTAVGIVHTCKGCVSPQAMVQCLEMTSKDAMCILKTVGEYVHNEFAKIEELKRQILQENGQIVDKVMKKFEIEVEGFVKHLDCCIAELKNLHKRCG